MTYRVVWLAALHDDLARLYLQAREDGAAEAVTRATDEIDRTLAASPGEGESRAGSDRVFIREPLCVYFEVHDEERVVVVTGVHYRRPKRRPA